MSYARERDEFIARMTREGLDLDTTRRLLRAATTLQRYAELACSSEAADRDRVPCPATRMTLTSRKELPCLCDYGAKNGVHDTIPRITLQDYRLTEQIKHAMPDGWTIDTQGDPRGYVLRVIPPSYAERNADRDRFNKDTIGVPSGPTGLRF